MYVVFGNATTLYLTYGNLLTGNSHNFLLTSVAKHNKCTNYNTFVFVAGTTMKEAVFNYTLVSNTQ